MRHLQSNIQVSVPSVTTFRWNADDNYIAYALNKLSLVLAGTVAHGYFWMSCLYA